MSTDSTQTVSLSHFGVAEYGKVLALKKKHQEALCYYRMALKLVTTAMTNMSQNMTNMAQNTTQSATENKSDDNSNQMMALRHYSECASESLEKMGAYAEVQAYLEQAIGHYLDHKDLLNESLLAQRDYFGLLVRRAAILIKMEKIEEAKSALKLAMDYLKTLPVLKEDPNAKFCNTLNQWLARGMLIPAQRVTREQSALKLFAVRQETVDAARAIELPNELLQQLMTT